MIRIIDLKTMKEAPPPEHCVLCLGNFDGVHIGHRALIMETSRQKERLCCYRSPKSGAWLFMVPPSFSLDRTGTPQLTTLTEKLKLFASLGLDYAFLADFEKLRDLEPSEFVNEVLKKRCHCVYAVCGFNFRFAKHAMADAAELQRLMDGNAKILDCVTIDDTPVSSSAIRVLLARGEVAKANKMLGHPYSLCAPVLHGKALGKTIGIPTVNQAFEANTMYPCRGVYASRTWVGETSFPSVSNIGIRPTFDDGDRVNCETHIIGYDGDLYGTEVKVEFFARLRDEKRFEDVEALRSQLKKDIADALSFFEKREDKEL